MPKILIRAKTVITLLCLWGRRVDKVAKKEPSDVTVIVPRC